MSKMSARQSAIQAITTYNPESTGFSYRDVKPTELFGCNVFNDKVMRERLPKAVYRSLTKTIRYGETLDPAIADTVAAVMKDWAIEHGATHYTHIFYPLTGQTAEKHDTFLKPDGTGGVIAEFSGSMLIRGEADGSSFPSGGLRATFEARGYTAWDVTSPAYLQEGPNCIVLCIPTMFLSWTGVVLDKKTPMLRSGQALNHEARRVLDLFNVHTELPVVAYAGLEQEYFLIDNNYTFAREDLLVAGRTLFGARPAKGQEFSDQYFGVIPQRVLSFMMETERYLYKLGVPVSTRHNEVAPGQYEIAPFFEQANVAVDHNHMIMAALRNVAKRHGLKCLLHEKPFNCINGSGKHLNYSVGNAELGSLFDPGDTPHANAKFLVFVCALVRAVHKYGGLLRATVASASNDHRLGANEAPPAIMSIFLGDQLTEVLAAFRSGHLEQAESGAKKTMMDLGVDTLPNLPRDPGDRNRTSPIAFVGNRFEFRALGSSQSASDSITALNAAMADSLGFAADWLEREIKEGKSFNDALQSFITHVMEEHSAVIFNGDGYSEVWQKEAVRRGLPDLHSAPDAIPVLESPEVMDLYVRLGIMNQAEVKARAEIYLEQYCKTIRTEAALTVRIARTKVYPAALAYLNQLASVCQVLRSLNRETETDTLDKVNKGLVQLKNYTDALEQCVASVVAEENFETRAGRCYHEILPAMEKVREIADGLEGILPEDLWSLPTYQEMLFNK